MRIVDDQHTATRAWHGHVPQTAGYRRLLAGLLLAGIATFAQLYSPQGLLPLISADVQISADQAALLISMATAGLALAVIPWSFVGDRLGRKKAMAIALMAALIFAVASVVAPSFNLMLVFRLLEGISLGGVPALAMAYLNEEVDRKYAGQTAGTYIAGTVIGGLIGRVIATPIGDWAGWRVGMLIVVVIAGISGIGFLLLSPDARGFTPSGHSVKHALVAITGNLKSPQLIVTYLQGMLLMGGFVAIYNFLGYHLMTEPFFLPAAVVSLIFWAYVMGIVTSPMAGRLATRYGPATVLLAVSPAMVISVALTLVPNVWAILWGLIIFTGAFFAAHSVASGWAGAAAVAGRAQSTALYNLCYYAGSSLFGWLGGVLLDAHGWPGTVMMTIVLTLIAALLVVAVVITRRIRHRRG